MSAALKRRPISQSLLLAATLGSGLLAAFFGFLYFSLYWPYRRLFNEQGRYFDGQNLIVFHEQAGLLIVPTLFFLAGALLFGFAWHVRRRAVGRAAADR